MEEGVGLHVMLPWDGPALAAVLWARGSDELVAQRSGRRVDAERCKLLQRPIQGACKATIRGVDEARQAERQCIMERASCVGGCFIRNPLFRVPSRQKSMSEQNRECLIDRAVRVCPLLLLLLCILFTCHNLASSQDFVLIVCRPVLFCLSWGALAAPKRGARPPTQPSTYSTLLVSSSLD